MVLHNVVLINGSETPVGEGINRPSRCLVRFEDQSTKAAILKRLSPEGVAAEAFCALLLRGWGLTVPEPAIVNETLGTSIAFGSIDAGYPNLKQKIGWSDTFPERIKEVLARHGSTLISGFADTPRALVADEAISNRDRNFGNILWDGQNVAWIDHERALGLSPDSDQNKLANFAIWSGNHNAILQSAVAISLSISPQAVTDSANACNGICSANEFSLQVSSRLTGLANRILNRFPQPPSLFNP